MYGEVNCCIVARRGGTHSGTATLMPKSVSEGEDVQLHHQSKGGHEGLDGGGLELSFI